MQNQRFPCRDTHTSLVSCTLIVTLLAILLFAAVPCEANDRLLPERVTFNAHIRPIMSNTCFLCHGPDDEDNGSGYRLDSFAAATRSLPSDEELQGIKPGDPDGSEVYRRIMGTSDGEQMPPEDFRHQLDDYEKSLFRRWIEQGAEYQQHWAYAPRVRPSVPIVDATVHRIVNPIDMFVVTRLERDSLRQSPLADKATLLRRLSLDLIGLPPTVAELDAFLADDSDDAYERQVERLLKSPHFGERMAIPWLDLVRFADTVGFHGDQNQRVFPYRDYVIQAFNDNMPFNQFTREQIAGDLLDEPTESQLVATAALRLNMMTREGGAQPQEYLAKYRADRVRTLGTAWLGSTLGCCECHNHKYDPFTAHDFYSLGAFFDGIRQWGVYSDYGYTPNADLKGFNNDYPFPPEVRLKSASLRAEIQLLQRERDELLAIELGESWGSASFRDWLKELRSVARMNPDGWLPAAVKRVSTSGETVHEVLDDRSVLLLGDTSDASERIDVTVSLPYKAKLNSLRVEVLPDSHHGGHVGRGESGRFTLGVSAFRIAKQADGSVEDVASKKPASRDANQHGTEEHNAGSEIKLAWSEADRRVPNRYRSGREPLGLIGKWRSGPGRWQLPADESQLPHTAVYHFAEPLELAADESIIVRLESGDVGRVRVSLTPVAGAIPGWPALSNDSQHALDVAVGNSSTKQRHALLSLFHRSTTPFAEQHPIARDYRDRILRLRAGMAMSLIAQPMPSDLIPVSRVLPRGNWQDASGELAPPSVPHFLPQPANDSGRQLTRLDLANWLTSPDNPLTPRHFVNRTWKQFFGTGLSAKLDDLGNQGEWPSHPLLLDWLASEFVESGWDIKHMVHLIVSSHTYQQAAATRDDLANIDPYNRLMSQQSARRLEAEVIRDNALAIAGLLQRDYVGGPSVFPYQPEGHYRNLQFPNRKYEASGDARQFRRGVYMHWQRTFLHPMLVNFDAPSRDECTADRPLSNSPQQALTLLNDPSFVEASRAMAISLLKQQPSAEFRDRLDSAFRRALARPATEREREALRKLFRQQREYYEDHPSDATKLLSVGRYHTAAEAPPSLVAAWSQICRVILNLHETITRY